MNVLVEMESMKPIARLSPSAKELLAATETSPLRKYSVDDGGAARSGRAELRSREPLAWIITEPVCAVPVRPECVRLTVEFVVMVLVCEVHDVESTPAVPKPVVPVGVLAAFDAWAIAAVLL